MNRFNIANNKELDKWIESKETIDTSNAIKVLKEVKQILGSFGVTFFLRQSTCLGAIRDNGFIPWDIDVDIGSVIGLHGLTEESLDQIVVGFRNNGFLTRIERGDSIIYLLLVKLSIRCDWICFKIIDDYIVQFPFLKTPLSLFTNLKEITFLDEKFYVPNPPEEYLRHKYGDDWQIPKRWGEFEEDVLNQATKMPAPNSIGELRQLIARYLLFWRASKIRVFDKEWKPVDGAEVIAVGLGHYRTDKQGCASFYVPQDDFYPLIVRFENQKKINYLQRIKPGEVIDIRLL